MSVNKVILIGHLGKDPVSKYLPNNDAVTNTSLATSEKWKDKQGQPQERTEWHNLVFYRQLAEIAAKYLKKGSLVYIEGKLTTRKWQDKETGQDRYMTEIIVNEMQMLGGKPEAEQSTTHQPAPRPATAQPEPGKSFDDFPDDIPFDAIFA